MFYCDKKLSFNFFKYIIISKYVFDACLVIELLLLNLKAGEGKREHYLFRRLTAFTDKRYFW